VRFSLEQLSWYAGLRAQYSFVEEEMVLDELGGARKGERGRYWRFVEEGLVREVENPFEAVRWQAVLGNETFVQRLRDRLKGLHRHRREIPSLWRIKEGVKTEEVLEKVAKSSRWTANAWSKRTSAALPRGM